jgi:hypothetical protein
MTLTLAIDMNHHHAARVLAHQERQSAMNTTNGDTPAFPGPWHNDGDGNAQAPDGQLCPPDWTVHMPGMSLRDYFAAKALQGSLPIVKQYSDELTRLKGSLALEDFMALLAYRYADAMLKARDAQ